jgi:hypothetical protein
VKEHHELLGLPGSRSESWAVDLSHEWILVVRARGNAMQEGRT